jgi:hypothetical protein
MKKTIGITIDTDAIKTSLKTVPGKIKSAATTAGNKISTAKDKAVEGMASGILTLHSEHKPEKKPVEIRKSIVTGIAKLLRVETH